MIYVKYRFLKQFFLLLEIDVEMEWMKKSFFYVIEINTCDNMGNLQLTFNMCDVTHSKENSHLICAPNVLEV